MFRKRDRQTTFLEASVFLPPEKAARLSQTWAEAFRTSALPLINEGRFSEMYCPDNGRPNRPVQTVLGVLFLKEMFNLTDADALEQLEFNLAWQHALALRPEEAHLCQKTLHNFRSGLMQHDLARVAFEETTDRIITDVEITPSSGSDAHHVVPVIEKLKERGIQPDEMVADTSYGSAENSLDAQRLGTELLSPVPGGSVESKEPENESDEAAPLAVVEFKIDPTGAQPTICPAGHPATAEFERDNGNRADVFYDQETCDACPHQSRCPVELHRVEGAGFHLHIDLKAADRERRRRAERSGEFAARYKIRAGIEATNSELKRRHGLGHIRVRGRPRVELAVYLNAAACNIKRMVAHLMGKVRSETAPMAV
jgi:hypothetical protein